MADRFAVGSIEEDFKKIGLMPKAVVEKVAAAADVVLEAVDKDKKPAPAAATATTTPAAESAEKVETASAEQTEGLKLLRKKRPTGKMRAERRKAKMLRRRKKGKLKLKAKRFRRSARGKRFLRKYKMAMKRFHGHPPKGRRVSLKQGLDRISSMLEEVQEIVTAIDGNERQETIKSFANLALIANKLAESFAFTCANVEVRDENDEELDLCGGAKHFEGLAETAATLAEQLQASMQEGAAAFEGSNEEIAETFSVMLNDVLEGLDVFADLAEGEEGEEASEDAEAAEEGAEVAEAGTMTRTQRDLTLDDDPSVKRKSQPPMPVVDVAEADDDDDDDDGDDDDGDADDGMEKNNDDDDASPDNDSNVDDDDGEKKKARPTK